MRQQPLVTFQLPVSDNNHQRLSLNSKVVSKILLEHPDVGEKTRQHVLERVKDLDYQPNSLARSLVTERSYLIGVIVPSLPHPFFAQIVESLSSVIRQKGYFLIVFSSEEDPRREKDEISRLLAHRLDALVIASCSSNTEQFERMESENQSYVLLDREFSELAANFVGIDDEKAGRLATEHLLDMGCRHVAHIRGAENSTGRGRFEGYKRALRQRGVPYKDEYVVSRNHVDTETTRQGAVAMRVLLKQHPRPDGVFCFNDPLAIGVMSTILEAGLRIPEDIALIGCANLHINDYLRVPLSSIDQHSEMLGQHAAELVFSLIESKQPPRARTIILEPSLVIRASTQRR